MEIVACEWLHPVRKKIYSRKLTKYFILYWLRILKNYEVLLNFYEINRVTKFYGKKLQMLMRKVNSRAKLIIEKYHFCIYVSWKINNHYGSYGRKLHFCNVAVHAKNVKWIEAKAVLIEASYFPFRSYKCFISRLNELIYF